MAVVASQLIAEISATGADIAQAQMDALSAANDATAVSFATVEAAATSGGAALATVAAESTAGDAGLASVSVGADAAAVSLTSVADAAARDAAANGEAIISFTDLGTAMGYVDAQAALAATAIQSTASPTLEAAMTTKELEKAQRAAFESQSAMLGGMQQMGAAIAPVVLIAGALGVVLAGVAAHMAGDFHAGITTLATGAGELDKNLGMVSQGILQMAVDTGTSTQQLIAGMYMIESAGFHGAAGLDILRAAAEGAKVGEASLADVANGVTTEMTDYASSGITAAQATNDLITAVSLGKTHMQDLATSLASILPTAAAAGVGLQDVMAAMATMTAEGTPAANAATYLRQTILSLEAPSTAASKMLAQVGLTTQQVATEMKTSLPGALQMITDAVGKKFPPGSAAYIAALKAIFGGTKQLQGALELTGQHLATFKNNVAAISSAVKKGGNDVAGWSLVQKDFNFQLSKAGAAVEVLFIKLGSALLPVLGKMLGAVTPLIQKFADWVSNGKAVQQFFTQWAPLLTAAAVIIGGILVAAFISWAIAAGAAAVATIAATWPILAIIAAVALLAAGIVLAVQHWGAISGWLKGTWTAVLNWFGTALKNVENFFMATWHKIQAITSTVWNAIVNAIKGFLAMLVGIFTGQFTAVANLFVWLYNHNTYFKALIDTIINIVKIGLAWLQNAWLTALTFIINKWTWIKSVAQVLWSALVVLISGFMLQVKQKITDTWNAIVSIFQGLWNRLVVPLLQVATNIINWAKNLANQAIQWGKNLIQSFINGLLSMLGALLNAAAKLAGAVAKALGFHSPTEYGPGKDADKWAPNLIKMFVAGLKAGMPEVQAAFDALVNPMGKGFNLGISSSGMRFPAMGGGSQPIQITIQAAPIYLDSRELVQNGIGQALAQQYWVQNGINTMPPLRS